MSGMQDAQAVFMEAVNGLKAYAQANGGTVTKDDVCNYFRELDIDESKLQMIYGYLMANNIAVQDEENKDNEFLKLMEQAGAAMADENENENGESYVHADDIMDAGAGSRENGSKREDAEPIDDEEDEKYLKLYMQDLQRIDPMTDTTRAFLLMNIVEDNDRESLQLFTESFLEKIVSWVEPYRGRGVLASDLLQEGNLAMAAYIGGKHWLNNYEWKDKIKEGGTQELLEVLSGIEEQVRMEVEEGLMRLLDEQQAAKELSGRILGRVNMVNHWAKLLRSELGRKPTVDEVAGKIGISGEKVMEAVRFSAEKIEDIDIKADKT